jgi:AmiR/NasT family two-component response regulator
MTNPIIKIHNVETGEVIEREMNAEEFAQWESDQAKAAAETQAKAEIAAAKAALLDKLGITEEEAKLLLS